MPYLLFLKKRQIFNFRLLQIIGGALSVKFSAWSRRFCLKIFLSLALVAILLGRAEPFMPLW